MDYQAHTFALCSYLDICISQKIRLCIVDLELTKGQRYQYFDLKIQIYYSHFSSFLHAVDAIPKRVKYMSCIFPSNCNSNILNSSSSV